MKHRFTRSSFQLSVIVFSIILILGASCTYAYDLKKGLSVTERQNTMDSFNQFEVDNEIQNLKKKAALCGETPSAEIQCSTSVSQPFRSRWFVDGKYRIEITYLNDNDHPLMYGSSDEQYQRFEVDRSLPFKEQMTQIIMSDYLGADYQMYSPKLLAVTEIVAIKLFVTNSDELKALIENPRVTDVQHIADNIRDVLVVPKY